MKKTLLTLLLVLISVAAFGQEGAHEAAGHEEGGIPRIVFFQALNFFGLIIILYFVIKNKVGGYFKQRHDEVAKAITEAKRIKTEAENRHQEYVIKLKELERDQDKMLQEIRREGEEAKNRMIEEARRLAENIRAEAKRAADNEAEKARAALYDDVLNQALDGARAMLAKNVAENDQRRLQKEFVEKIEAVQ